MNLLLLFLLRVNLQMLSMSSMKKKYTYICVQSVHKQTSHDRFNLFDVSKTNRCVFFSSFFVNFILVTRNSQIRSQTHRLKKMQIELLKIANMHCKYLRPFKLQFYIYLFTFFVAPIL